MKLNADILSYSDFRLICSILIFGIIDTLLVIHVLHILFLCVLIPIQFYVSVKFAETARGGNIRVDLRSEYDKQIEIEDNLNKLVEGKVNQMRYAAINGDISVDDAEEKILELTDFINNTKQISWMEDTQSFLLH